ncbi:TlpA family protein disulfide reductase [Pedobacter metabolipauper]|uniref:Peroxiredoxin n=1 Tax=Pedobacter metabolipauper TaxID=425513 RepID=A0A4V3D100_9SPHI|nr:TlpA disulfide reductase family protein [Pedobacter metabolipauper]TDQ08454.1 peroxiredoxin [Pedobacter metabolipauper]
MKKTVILFSLFLSAYYCSGQSIDTAALGILQRSYDKLAKIETLSYQLIKLDTMIREGRNLSAIKSAVRGTIKKNGDWYMHFEDHSAWLLHNDTLYKKQPPHAESTTYTTRWNSHDLTAFSAHNILGTQRPVLRWDIASLAFVPGSEKEKFYIIDIVRKKIDYGTAEIESKEHYNRYWIDKKSLLPVRRMMYGKRLESGKEAIDIYDFSVSITTSDTNDYDLSEFLSGPLEEEAEKTGIENLETGTMAPSFSATDVRNGKPVSQKEYKGKVVLLDFWYISCMPCRILIPKIQRLQEKFKNEDVAIIGINVSDSSSTEIMKFLKERKILFSQYYKTGSLAKDYKLYAFPTTMIIGRDGRVKLVEVGEAENIAQKLEQAIRKELESPAPVNNH